MNRFIVVLFTLSSLHFYGQLNRGNFEAVKNINDAKKKFIFIYTDWCGICHKMENTTFKDNEIVTLLNESFYFLPLNAESKEPIEFAGHLFEYIPHGTRSGIHELAKQLGTVNGTIAYPTICILNENNEIIFQIASALSSKELLSVLNSI